MDTVIVNLPFFPGFYESILSGMLDNAEERVAYNEAERESSQYYYPETYQPEATRLDQSDYQELIFDCMDYSGAHDAMSRDYAAAFDCWARHNMGTPEGAFAFESVSSPRYYNSETDRLFVTVPLAVMQTLYDGFNRDKLAAAIAERHTSYDGFHSFYSANDIDAWDKPLADMDHNELATVLCAAMAPHIDDKRDFSRDICESLAESDYEYVDNYCDWNKLADLVAVKREGMRQCA